MPDEANPEAKVNKNGLFGSLEGIKLDRRAVGAGIMAFVFNLVLVVCCFVIGADYVAKFVNIALLILGCSIGWVIGTFFSPYQKDEEVPFQDQIKTMSKYFTVFATGLTAAKLTEIQKFIADLHVSSLHKDLPFRCILLAAAVLIATMYVFCVRRYDLEFTVTYKNTTQEPDETVRNITETNPAPIDNAQTPDDTAKNDSKVDTANTEQKK